ncbi:MAG: Gfo/Idh/MocA family oxidoreductase [Nitrospirae bacterium]|nr:MAG: Gfo/Idh/MocA family oxidoreductase [Nitrospirota bacterium]
MSIGMGLIGLGRHGARYAKHLLAGVPGCRLVAVSRQDIRAGAQFAEEHGIPFYADWRDLLRRSDVQAVLVVTPPSLNREICLAAAQAGKALLIEKPLACSTAEATAMVEAAQAAGVPLMTAQTLRFTPVLRRLREQLATIGPVEFFSLCMRAERPPHAWLDQKDKAGGGVVLEIGIHHFDLLRYLTGQDVIEVRAETARRHTKQVEDLAQVRFTLASGAACFVELSRVSGGRLCRAEAIGQKGQLTADVGTSTLTRIEGWKVVEVESVPDRPTIEIVLEAFARCLKDKAPMPVSGEDGLRAVAMAEAAYRSAALGKPVDVG